MLCGDMRVQKHFKNLWHSASAQRVRQRMTSVQQLHDDAQFTHSQLKQIVIVG